MAFLRKSEVQAVVKEVSKRKEQAARNEVRRDISIYLEKIMENAKNEGKFILPEALKLPSILLDIPEDVKEELKEAGWDCWIEGKEREGRRYGVR